MEGTGKAAAVLTESDTRWFLKRPEEINRGGVSLFRMNSKCHQGKLATVQCSSVIRTVSPRPLQGLNPSPASPEESRASPPQTGETSGL